MRKAQVFVMTVPKLVISKRVAIAATMAIAVTIVMIVSFVWGPASV